ncbi:hypothetical protein LZS94_18255 [Aliivibrio fischeri]|uniref:hypothetical protein n=1 Tax=Aliivibrio fischeri TaxID=668 RepID=UPI001F36E4CE|nr:hypothetical protein [Aliivibrio fischeri]MCE7579462.1 hypothetical protein [Aliivibrio fischeri]MCE7591751.1 hypothetical protein [Aliivibrio fischeri]
MYKLFFSITCFMLAFPSLANEEWSTMSYFWGQDNQLEASVWLKNKNDPSSEQVISSFIAHSTNGTQNIYFMARFVNDYNMCNVNDTNDGIFKIDNQAVKAYVWCKKFSDSSKYYLQMTAETNKGQQYIVDRFKKATKYVRFEFNGISVNIPAKGFTHIWNNAGGNAI